MNSVKRLVLLAMCTAILIIGKFILLYIPNLEVVTFLLIIYTLVFRLRDALLISTVYTIVIFILWNIQPNLYIWTIIVLVTSIFKKIIKENFILWAIYAGFFGLIYGSLCALPIYIFFKYFSNLFHADQTIGGYILVGLPFDAIHMIGNYFFMILLGEIVYKKLRILIKNYYF